jgi:hypothetical protein
MAAQGFICVVPVAEAGRVLFDQFGDILRSRKAVSPH